MTGIDLVDMFESHEYSSKLNFVVNSLLKWQPTQKYDLITCVHGLHYIGDKLAVIQKCIDALQKDGLFIANIDLDNIKNAKGESLKKDLLKLFKTTSIDYNSKTKIISCRGNNTIDFMLKYLGANDKIGKNYTGQEVVDSHYSI